jgi:hypothetical protein
MLIPTGAVLVGGVALILVIIGLVVFLTLNSPGVF